MKSTKYNVENLNIAVISLLIAAVTFFLYGFTNSAELNNAKYSPLFKIERSRDANQVFYELNLGKDGMLNQKNPIKIYWKKYESGEHGVPLTWIQNSFAYGIKLVESKPNFSSFQFVSYDKRNFIIKKNGEGEFKVFTRYQGKEIEIYKFFVQIDGGSFWFPKIPRVEIHGLDTKSKTKIIETLNF